MTPTNPHSSDFSYKKYSLEQLDNWVNDAVNCEDLTPQDIYETILKCVNESVVYHKKYYTKSVELLSLLKGHRNVDFGDMPQSLRYTDEEMDAMCDAAQDKEKCREYNLREAEYYNKRAELDALEKSKYYWDSDRNK
jgi:hypothetical protein